LGGDGTTKGLAKIIRVLREEKTYVTQWHSLALQGSEEAVSL
jgi:hypothetical protein